jgi:hypothetical protein
VFAVSNYLGTIMNGRILLRMSREIFIGLLASSLLLISPAFYGATSNERILIDSQYYTISKKVLTFRPGDRTYYKAIKRDKDKNWHSVGNFNDTNSVIRNIDTEIVWVDLDQKLTGVWIGAPPKTCSKSKPSIVRTQTYNACNSYFYRADVGQKVLQAAIMCAILACLGGYSEDWNPVFSVSRFSKAVKQSNFIPEALSYDREKQQEKRIENRIAGVETALLIAADDFQKSLEEHQRKIKLTHLKQYALELLKADRVSIEKDLEELKSLVTTAVNTEDREVKEALEKNTVPILDNLRNKYESVIAHLSKSIKRIEANNRVTTKEIQRALSNLGYYSKVDGIYGVETESALTDLMFDLESPPLKNKDLDEILKFIMASMIPTMEKCIENPALINCVSARHDQESSISSYEIASRIRNTPQSMASPANKTKPLMPQKNHSRTKLENTDQAIQFYKNPGLWHEINRAGAVRSKVQLLDKALNSGIGTDGGFLDTQEPLGNSFDPDDETLDFINKNLVWLVREGPTSPYVYLLIANPLDSPLTEFNLWTGTSSTSCQSMTRFLSIKNFFTAKHIFVPPKGVEILQFSFKVDPSFLRAKCIVVTDLG